MAKQTIQDIEKKKQARLQRSLKERDKHAVKEVGQALAERVLYMVDGGLVCGIGTPVRGQMCVEAAICYAMGEEHNDSPSCVHHIVRNTKIDLNDLSWSSDKARAKGMRRIAVAQLGSKDIDGKLFLSTLGELLFNLLLSELKDFAKQEGNKDGLAFLNKLYKEKSFAKRYAMLANYPSKEKENLLYGLDGVYDSLCELALNMKKKKNKTSPVYSVQDWWDKAKFGKELDERLTRIAECIEKALVKCKSKGTKWLYLCEA